MGLRIKCQSKFLRNGLQKCLQLFSGLHFLQQDHILVSAESSDHAPLSHQHLHDLRHSPDDLVTKNMPVGIIDMFEIININDHQPSGTMILAVQLFDGVLCPCPLVQQTGSGISGCRSQIIGFLLPVSVRGYDARYHITLLRDPCAFDLPYSLVLLPADEFHLEEIVPVTQMCAKGPQLIFQSGNITALMCLFHIPDQRIHRPFKLVHGPLVDIFIDRNTVLFDQIFKKVNIFQCHKMTVLQNALLQS